MLGRQCAKIFIYISETNRHDDKRRVEVHTYERNNTALEKILMQRRAIGKILKGNFINRIEADGATRHPNKDIHGLMDIFPIPRCS